jgi:signal transduction histidine kinase
MLTTAAGPAEDTSVAPHGLSVEVVAAGVVFAVGAGITALSTLSPQDPPSALLLLGWSVSAVVGGVLLDQRPGSRLGRTLTGVAVAPAAILAWAVIRRDGVESPDLAFAAAELAALLGGAVGITLPWAFRPPRNPRLGVGLACVALVGALVVLAAEVGGRDGTVSLGGWLLVLLATIGVWVQVLASAHGAGRTVRRRVGWLLTFLAAAGVAVAGAWIFGPASLGIYVTCGALTIGAAVAAGLEQGTSYRPLDEHLLDVGLLLAIAAAAGTTAGLVRLGSELTDRPSSATTTVFTAVLAAAMAVPVALWTRRAILERRYGTGLIGPEDVAVITAGLHAQTDPRDLLDKAARMVAAASGSSEVRIVLGDEDPSTPEHWLEHPLEVGGDRVGSLLIGSPDPEGPEARQQRAVAQLMPTVALVARAVGLAVEAEHARRDAARERDAERKRVMGDLHDGLGPVLAGMSMRVQAALRTATSPDQVALLTDLAEELATGRADLRRIVAGITPSTLEDGDLEGALHSLVASFRGATATPDVLLSVVLDHDLAPEVKVAVYRSVAEGITNGLRHASPTTIAVSVRTADGRVVAEVTDDGVGGPVVPGVGLSSLSRRAEGLGGRLTVCPGRPGTTLHLELPATGGAS